MKIVIVIPGEVFGKTTGLARETQQSSRRFRGHFSRIDLLNAHKRSILGRRMTVENDHAILHLT